MQIIGPADKKLKHAHVRIRTLASTMSDNGTCVWTPVAMHAYIHTHTVGKLVCDQ